MGKRIRIVEEREGVFKTNCKAITINKKATKSTMFGYVVAQDKPLSPEELFNGNDKKKRKAVCK